MNDCVINHLPLYNSVHNLIANNAIVIKTVWTETTVVFRLFLKNDQKGFGGTLLTSSLTSTANSLEINSDEFVAETKDALCSENGLPEFTYVIEATNIFRWSKSTQGFRIKYGEIVLEDRPEAVEEMLMDSIRINRSKDQQIQTLKSDVRRMDDRFNEMQLLLEKCVDEKNNIETELLAKFTALLNTKKKKITELEAIIKNRSIEANDFESDGNDGDDSDLEYSSQVYARDISPVPSTSIQPGKNDAIVVPKRLKNKPAASELIVNVEEAQSMDIYDRETEVLIDDM